MRAQVRVAMSVALAGLLMGCQADYGPGITMVEPEKPNNVPSNEILSEDPRASLYVIGVAQGAGRYGGDDERARPITVRVAKAEGQDIQLALSSYRAGNWTIDGDGAHRVSAVLLMGHHAQTVAGQRDDAKVVDRSGRGEALKDRRRELRRSGGFGGAGWGSANANALRGAGGRDTISCAYSTGASGLNCAQPRIFIGMARRILQSDPRAFAGAHSGELFVIGD